MSERYVTDQQHVLADLARSGGDERQETSVVVCPGTGPGAWAVRIAGHVDRNVYTVQPVLLGDIGAVPVDIGQPTEATNLAESFLSQGTLAAGTYAVMSAVGDTNVFYAVP